MPLIAIGNTVANAQNYTSFVRADSIELQQQQGNTDDTLKLQVWDPVSSFPLAPEDEIYLIDETDANGWPSCNLLANPSLEGTYVTSGATGASGTFAPSWTVYSNAVGSGTLAGAAVTSGALFASTCQQLTVTNLALGGQFSLMQTLTLPVNEKGAPILTLPYSLSCWYFVSTACTNLNLQVQIDWLDKNAGYLSSSIQSVTSPAQASAWARLAVTATAPANSAQAKISVTFTPAGSATNSGVVLVDGVQFEYNTFVTYASSVLPISGYQNSALATHTPARPAPATTALSVYATNSAATTLPNAALLAASGGSVSLASQTSLVGTATGWGEVTGRGTAAAWAAGASAGTPTGRGFLYDATALEHSNLVAGTWTQKIRLATSVGSLTATVLGRWYVYDAALGTYTALGTSTLSAQSITTTFATYTLPGVALGQSYVGPQQKLYVDIWLNITTNGNANSTLTVKIGDLGGDAGPLGGTNESVTTPGYQAVQPVVADGWVTTGALPGLTYSASSIGGNAVQQITLTNPAAPGGGLTATRGIAQDQVAYNPLASYTATLTYQVTATLSANAAVRCGVVFEDSTGTALPGGTLVTTAPAGQTADAAWSTISFRFGPTVPGGVPPGGTRKLNIFAGVVLSSTAAAQGGVALGSLTITADAPQLQGPNAALMASAAGVYPTPFIDPAVAGNGTSMVWYDREVSGLYYRAQRWFGGYIKHAKQNYGSGPERIWDLDCVDFGVALGEALVVLVVRATGTTIAYNPAAGLSDAAAIKAACDYAHNAGYLKGLDYTSHVANLTTLPALSFNWQTVRDVLSAICDITVAAYWVDPYRYLWYQAALTQSAPFALAQTPDLVTSFPMEEWAIDYDSTQTRTTAVIQGSTQLSSPQSQTFYGYVGTLQGALTQNNTYTTLTLTPNSARLSAYGHIQVGTTSAGQLFDLVSDVLPTPPSAPSLTATSGTSTFASGLVYVSYTYTYTQADATGATHAMETAPSPQASVSVTGTGQVVTVSAITPATSGAQTANDFTGINVYVSPSAGSTAVKYSVAKTAASGTVASFTLTAYGTGVTPPTTVTAYLLATTTASASQAVGTSATLASVQVNGRQPVFNVTAVTVGGSAQTVALASTTTSGYNCYVDPQPALVTFDTTAYPANAAAIVVTYTYENPVLIRVTAPGGASLSTNGRLIAFYQNVTNIQSVQDAIDQANAILSQYGQPQAIGHVVLHWPPCPVGQNITRGQYITITHVPSLGSSPVKFQVQRVLTRVFGNGVIRREMDLGFFRPDFATQMSQVTQDAAHLATDQNASSVLNDVLSITDSYTFSDSGPTGTVGHTAVWGTNAWNDGTAYA